MTKLWFGAASLLLAFGLRELVGLTGIIAVSALVVGANRHRRASIGEGGAS